MAPLHRLLELAGIAQQDDALCRLGNSQDVRQGHLGGFINEEDVDGPSCVWTSPQPRGARRDMAGTSYRREQLAILRRELKPWHVAFLLANFLNASDAGSSFLGGPNDFIQKI